MTRIRGRRWCHDCGCTNLQSVFPGTHKPYRRFDRCVDCVAEFERLEPASLAGPQRRVPVQTRAAYRAALRHRAKQRQGDLVDLLVTPQ